MNSKIHNSIRALKTITLSDGEKNSLRASLLQYAESHAAYPSPYIRFFAWVSRPIQLRAALALILLVVLVSGSGTIAYGAEISLPGDFLYPVKTNITEPLQEALAITPVAKAKVIAAHAERRITEAEILASENRLSTSTTEALQKKFAGHIRTFNALRQAMATHHEAGQEQEIEKNFKQELDRHEAMRERIDPAFHASEQKATTTRRQFPVRPNKPSVYERKAFSHPVEKHEATSTSDELFQQD